jgi:RNA polymerase sigma factor (sigma-70 family)
MSEIIEGFRQSQKDIIVDTFKRLLPNIIALLAKYHARHLANDLAWEGIGIFWEKCQKPDFVLKESPLAYIRQICRNKWLDRLKTKEQLVKELPELPFNDYDPFDEYADLWAIVERELVKMNETCQEILNLRRQTDNYDEIIQQLNISYENARYRYSTCLAKLRTLISNLKK